MAQIDIATQLSVSEAIEAIGKKVGQTTDPEFGQLVRESQDAEDFRSRLSDQLGSSGFISFARLAHHEWTDKMGKAVDCYLFVLGNPLLAKPMLDINPLAGLYVPPRLLVYRHSDGFAHVCFDSLEDNLKELGDDRLLAPAKIVDDKLRALASVCKVAK